MAPSTQVLEDSGALPLATARASLCLWPVGLSEAGWRLEDTEERKETEAPPTTLGPVSYTHLRAHET